MRNWVMCIVMLFWGLHRPHSDFNWLGDAGLEASAQMATSPSKEEKRKKNTSEVYAVYV